MNKKRTTIGVAGGFSLFFALLCASCSETLFTNSSAYNDGYTFMGYSDGSEEEGSAGLAFYKKHSDGDVYVDRGRFSGSSLVIPVKYRSETVSGVIADSKFANDLDLTSVDLGAVTSIGAQAFMNTGITNLSLPSGLTALGKACFANCAALSTLDIATCTSASFTAIPEYCFAGDSALADFTFPNQITTIGECAFQGCENLTRAMLPWGLTTLGDFAYSDCSNITLVYFPKDLSDYGEYAFLNVNQSAVAYFSGKRTNDDYTSGTWNYISTDDYSYAHYLAIADDRKNVGDASYGTCTTTGGTWHYLYNYPADGSTGNDVYIFRYLGGDTTITSLIIPLQDDDGNNIIGVRANVFQNHTEFTSISFSDGFKYIEQYAFSGCAYVSSLKWSKNSTLTSIGYCAFYNLGWYVYDDYYHSKGSDFAETYYDGANNVTYQSATAPYADIPDDAELKDGDFVFPNTLTEIGGYAFQNARIIRSVIFRRGGSADQTIGLGAFSGCYGLSALSFSEKVTEIDQYAFALSGHSTENNATAISKRQGWTLHSVYLPATITKIEANAFHRRTNCCLYYASIGSNWETSNEPKGYEWNRGFGFESSGGLDGGLFDMKIPTFQITASKILVPHYFYQKNYFDFYIYESGKATVANSYFDFLSDTDIDNTTMVVPRTITYNSVTYTVDRLERGSFANCYCTGATSAPSLRKLYLPSGITTIGQWAAANSRHLTHVNSYTGDFTSTSASNVSADTFPSSLLYLGQFSFFYSNLLDVNLPSTILSMDFNGNNKTEDGNHPNVGTWTANRDPFIADDALATFSITGADDGTTQGTQYSSYENALYTKDLTTFRRLAPKATNLILSAACTTILDGACKDNTVLLTATLNDLFTAIPAFLFSGDTALNTVTLSKDITSIGDSAFSGCTNLATFKNTNSVTGATGVLDLATLYPNLETIGNSSFQNNYAITSITTDAKLTSIGTSAFKGSSAVTSVTLTKPDTALTLGNSCFNDMDGLTTISFPTTGISQLPTNFAQGSANLATLTGFNAMTDLTTIGDTAFANTALTSVTIPSSVTTLGSGAFTGVSALSSLTFAAGYDSTTSISIGANAFSSCTGMSQFVFPARADFSASTTKANSAFLSCSSSAKIYLGCTGAAFTSSQFPYNTTDGSAWNAYKTNTTSGYYLPFYVYSETGSGDIGSMNATTMLGYAGTWHMVGGVPSTTY